MKKDHLKNYLKAVCVGRTHRMTSQELEHELGLSGTRFANLSTNCGRIASPLPATATDISMPLPQERFMKQFVSCSVSMPGFRPQIRGLEESLHEIGTKGGHANG